MQKPLNLQDGFLAQARRDKLSVTIFLMNGYQLRGRVAGYDPFTVILMTEGRQQLIYKHAIATVIPERPVVLASGETGET
jgi:host factor-I protein